jgi:hypothetical protein
MVVVMHSPVLKKQSLRSAMIDVPNRLDAFAGLRVCSSCGAIAGSRPAIFPSLFQEEHPGSAGE